MVILLLLVGYILKTTAKKPTAHFNKTDEHITKLAARYGGMNLGNSFNLHQTAVRNRVGIRQGV